MTALDVAPEIKIAVPAPMQLTILGILWRNDRWMTLNAVHKAVCREYKQVALTTTSTIIIRMVEYGWVVRSQRPGAYIAGISRDELIALIVDKIESVGTV